MRILKISTDELDVQPFHSAAIPVNESFYLVDLPGYGYAKVPKKMRQEWQGLVSSYLENRESLRCVVVIVDLRHSVKVQDLKLIEWLRSRHIPFLPVYTKLDKLSRNERGKHASVLDSGFNISPRKRILFSAKTGEGKDFLKKRLDQFLD